MARLGLCRSVQESDNRRKVAVREAGGVYLLPDDNSEKWAWPKWWARCLYDCIEVLDPLPMKSLYIPLDLFHISLPTTDAKRMGWQLYSDSLLLTKRTALDVLHSHRLSS